MIDNGGCPTNPGHPNIIIFVAKPEKGQTPSIILTLNTQLLYLQYTPLRN